MDHRPRVRCTIARTRIAETEQIDLIGDQSVDRENTRMRASIATRDRRERSEIFGIIIIVLRYSIVIYAITVTLRPRFFHCYLVFFFFFIAIINLLAVRALSEVLRDVSDNNGCLEIRRHPLLFNRRLGSRVSAMYRTQTVR